MMFCLVNTREVATYEVCLASKGSEGKAQPTSCQYMLVHQADSKEEEDGYRDISASSSRHP